MGIVQDMRKLSQELIGAYDERGRAVADIRVNTAGLITGYQSTRQDIAREQRAARRRYMEELRQGVADYLGDASQARQEMAKTQREALKRAMADVAQSVAELRDETAQFMQETQSAREDMSEELRDQLRSQLEVLRSDVARLMKELNEAHQSMAEAMRHDLGDYREKTLEDVRHSRARLQAEMREARRVWSSLQTLLQRRRARTVGKTVAPVGQPFPKPVSLAQPKPEPVSQVAEEPTLVSPPLVSTPEPEAKPMGSLPRLTDIKGIGASSAKRLQEAGISDVAVLARCTPERVRAALEEQAGRLAKVEDWIRQAQDMVGEWRV